MLVPKRKFTQLLRVIYFAFFKLRPDLIASFSSQDTNLPNIYIGRDDLYSFNDLQQYVLKEIMGKGILNQSSQETVEKLLREVYKTIIK